MKVRHNDKTWVIKKSLKDFEQLSEIIARQYPDLELPKAAWNIEIRKQLEDYFRVRLYSTYRS